MEGRIIPPRGGKFMPSIFISYAREQKSEAAILAQDLSAAGYTVWWDHLIHAGTEFDRDIREHITAAEAVIVIWSDEAAASRWVKGEARMALDFEKLIPVRVGPFDVKNLPIDFQTYHTADLDDRSAILSSIAAKIGKPPSGSLPAEAKMPGIETPQAERQHDRANKESDGRRRRAAVALAVAMAVVIAGWGGWELYDTSRQTQAQTTFDAVKAENDILAWDTYLAEPDAPFRDEAEAERTRLIALKKAESEKDYANARENGTVEAWDSFLNAYQPYGNYINADHLLTAGRLISECSGVSPDEGHMNGAHACLVVNPQRTVAERARDFPTCGKYLGDFRNFSQQTLANRAIWKAKDGDDDGAYDEISACFCGGLPEWRDVISTQIYTEDERRRMICWLRSQPRPPKPDGL